MLSVIPFLSLRQTDIRSVDCLKEVAKVGSVIKETSLYLRKRGCDEITIYFIALRTNLFFLVQPDSCRRWDGVSWLN